MNDDLISRQAAIDELAKFEKQRWEKMRFRPLVSDRVIIKSLPSVQPEQKTGYWFDVGSLSCRCSECGGKSNRESRYCPNCGAWML